MKLPRGDRYSWRKTKPNFEIRMWGDGRPTFDPKNGWRVFNSKEDDAAAEAKAKENVNENDR